MRRSLSDTDDMEVRARILAAKQKMWGNMTLYFGCRRSDLDYIYKDELMRAKVSGALTDVHVAFSREPKKPKVSGCVCIGKGCGSRGGCGGKGQWVVLGGNGSQWV